MNFKTIKIFFILIVTVIFFTSCKYIYKKEIETISEISTFPIFVLDGGELMTHDVGEPWVEPGYHCSEVEEGADDLNSSVIVDDSEMDENTRGLYTIYYTATNSYGYELTVTRNVLVSEVGNLYNIAGTYSRNFGTVEIQIDDAETDGFWEFSDLIVYGLKIDAPMADLGDLNYIIPRTYLKRRIDLQHVYVKGTAVYDSIVNPNEIAFRIIQIYEDGSPLSNDTLKIDFERE